MKLGEGFIVIRADDKEAQAAFKSLESKGSSAASGIATAMKLAFAGFALKGAIDQASRLEQAVGGTIAVFGEASKEIDEFAETSADGFGISQAAARELTSQIGGLLKGLGFTKDEAAKTSVGLSKLGADLAAAFGGKPEEAVMALGSALRGEFNPLERFGVSLNVAQINLKAVEMGLATSTAKVDLNARAQAALALITERTTDITGQFARESDTAAGAQARAAAKAEDASAKFGQRLLPIYTKAMEIVGSLAEAFGNLPGPIQTVIVAIAGLILLKGPLTALATSLKGFFTALAAGNPVLLATVAAVAVAGALFIAFSSDQDVVAEKSKELAKAVAEAAGQLDVIKLATLGAADAAGLFSKEVNEAAAAQLKKSLEDKNQIDDLNRLGVTLEDLAGLYGTQAEQEATLISVRRKLIESGEIFIAQQGNLSEGMDRSREEVKALEEEYIAHGTTLKNIGVGQHIVISGNRGLADTFQETADVAGATTERLVELAGAGDAEAAAALKARGEMDQLNDAQRQRAEAALAAAAAEEEKKKATDVSAAADKAAAEAAKEVTVNNQSLAQAYEAAADAASAFKRAVDLVTGGALSAFEANKSYEEALDGVAERLKGAKKGTEGYAKGLDVGTEAGRKNIESLLALKTASDQTIEAFVRQGGSAEEAAAKLGVQREGLIGLATQFGLSTAEAEAFVTQLGLTPENIATTVQLYNEEAAKGELQGWLDSLQNVPSEKVSAIKAALEAGDFETARALLEELAGPRDTPITTKLLGDKEASANLDKASADRDVNVKVTPIKVPETKKQLDDTAKERDAKVVAQNPKGQTVKQELDNTAKPRDAFIRAIAQTATANSDLAFASRTRTTLVVMQIMNAGSFESQVNNLTRNRTINVTFNAVNAPPKRLGGPVLQGQPYEVGEEGPELFIPETNGTIIPNGQYGSSGTAVGGTAQQVTEVIQLTLDSRVVYETVRHYDRLVRGGAR